MGHSQSHSLRGSSGASGTTSSSSSRGFINTNAPPLQFHPTAHGANIRIDETGFCAERYESFCKGILFSNRPVAIGERVYLRISQLSTRWSGVIRVGFTTCPPDHILPQHLPKCACPDLTSKPGYWAKALSERYVEANNLLHYYVNGHGDVHFGVNGQDRGVFFSGVDTRGGGPLWAMIDLYGNCTSLELIDMRRDLNNRPPTNATNSLPRNPQHQHQVHHQQTEQMFNSYHADQQPNYFVESGELATNDRLEALQSQINSMSLSRPMPHQPPPQYRPPPSASVISNNNNSVLPLTHNRNVPFRPMTFHFCTGRNVSLNEASSVAGRHEDEFAQGYVFTAAPIQPSHRIVVQVLSTEDSYIGSLAFGLTNCDPSSVDTRELPEDSDLLLDRPEYWVVSKDVAASPAAGDELSFNVCPDGSVEFSKNGAQPSVFMHVDVSQRLWAFWDVYGNTSKIRLIGTTNSPIEVPQPQPPPPPQQQPIQQQQQQQHYLDQPLVNLSSLPAPLASNGQRMAPTHIPNEAIPPGIGECSVCLERQVDCAIYTCGHMCMCYPCSMTQWKRVGGGFCPICRGPIRDVIRTFRA